MSLYKRGNVYWSYVWQDGVRYGRSTHTGKLREAEKTDHAHKAELEAKKHQPAGLNPEMTFDELFARFVGSGALKPFHLDRSKPLLTYFGAFALKDITKGAVGRFRVARKEQKTKLSQTTINRDLECLRHLLYWAVDEGILLSNPLHRLRLERERRPKRPVLSVAEEDALLNAAAKHLRPMLILGLDTGMRRGELLSQLWEDIDFEEQLLFVSHSKTPEGESREIPLTHRAFEWLRRNRQPSGPLFVFNGTPMKRPKTGWDGAVRRAGIRRIRLHDLRHTFNTRLMLAGVQQEIRKALMGHSSGEDVNSIYTHVELPAKRDAIRKLEEWLAMRRRELSATPRQGETNDQERTTEQPDSGSDPRASEGRSERSPKEMQRGFGAPPEGRTRCRHRSTRRFG